MLTNSEKILAKGLQDGYAGESKRSIVKRGPFTLTTTELVFPEFNGMYIDQWIAKRIGGGQEISQAKDEMATRVFAGGIVKPEIIKALGISEEDVLTYHKSTLSVLAGKTRLHENVTPDADGDWQYSYKIIKEYPELPLTIGIETISYKNTDVFVHVFLNSPIV